MIEQKVLSADDNFKELDDYLIQKKVKRLFLVCGHSMDHLSISEYFKTLPSRTGIEVVRFSEFTPNPLYEEVVSGEKNFRDSDCDAIVAVGGGSAIDVAKCIKLYFGMDDSINYLQQTIVPNKIPFIAIPTTAGTGSEATRFAVIYYEGEKQSISDDSCIPAVVVMDPTVLDTLPDYQRKATMMDAMCHAIESFWSINSTDESKELSKQALKIILANMDAYLKNEPEGNANMLLASNLAGKAINITQTTAGHAMCYKLTSLYDIAHGHAAALCVAKLWPYMIKHVEQCADPRGEDYLNEVFNELSTAMGCKRKEDAAQKFQDILNMLCIETPTATVDDYELLKTSVNPVRLKNHPIMLDEAAIDGLYHQILKEKSA